MLLRKLNQENFNADYQGVTITTFSYQGKVEVINFLNSDYFRIDCIRDDIIAKPQEQQDKYLKPAFNLEKLSIEDFRILNQIGLIAFFDDYVINGGWEESDRNGFIKVWDKLKVNLLQLEDSFTFYLISKEWFENQDSRDNPENADIRLKEPEFWIYGYYFLVVGISKAKQELKAIVWFND